METCLASVLLLQAFQSNVENYAREDKKEVNYSVLIAGTTEKKSPTVTDMTSLDLKT